MVVRIFRRGPRQEESEQLSHVVFINLYDRNTLLTSQQDQAAERPNRPTIGARVMYYHLPHICKTFIANLSSVTLYRDSRA